MYGTNEDYKEWKIEIIEPIKKLTGQEKVYYEMASHFCDNIVASHSWFVRLRFPKLLPAQSASLGELFITKNQEDWIV